MHHRIRKLNCALFAACAFSTPRVNAQLTSTWIAGSGSWSVAANWNNGVPNGPAVGAIFQSLAANAAVTLDAPVELGRLSYLHPSNVPTRPLTISGTSFAPLTMNTGNAAHAKVLAEAGAGTMTLALPLNL